MHSHQMNYGTIRKLSRFLGVAALAFGGSPSFAQSNVEPVKITRIANNSEGSTFLRVSQRAPYSGSPSCAVAGSGWDFTFNASTPAGQAMLSVALSAYLNDKSIRVVGTGTCASSTETLYVVDILE